MGKKGSGDPMQAFRKAEKAKQLKKNKAQRKETREKQAVWRDTRDLETDIAHLKARTLDDEGKARLATLESELAYVMKLKEKYVAEHPESKDKVYHTREQREQRERPRAARPDPTAHLYNPDGTLRDPKRSIYYDATYNPFGVPPPGMPYAERPPSDDSDSDDSDSDSDIVMPDGPRPDESDADSDSDDSDDSDDIPLPAGPPPRPVRPPFRPPPRPPRTGWGHLMPGAAQPGAPGAPARPVRPPPPSFPVRPSSLPPRPPSLPAKPGTVSGPRPAAPAAAPAAATISAAPQLRDLRKEVTVFVPRAARKRAPGGVTVNATPGAGVVDADGDSVRVRAARPGLMDKLGRVLGDEEKKDQTEEEYERFLAGL